MIVPMSMMYVPLLISYQGQISVVMYNAIAQLCFKAKAGRVEDVRADVQVRGLESGCSADTPRPLW